MTILVNEVYHPTEGFFHLCIHRICLSIHFSDMYFWRHTVLLRIIMKLERHLHIACIRVFPTYFHRQKMLSQDHATHYHSQYIHKVYILGKFLNFLQTYIRQQAVPCLHSHLLETLMLMKSWLPQKAFPQRLN